MPSSSIPPVIRNISPNLTTFSMPFSRFGVIPIGGRSTAVKLSGDKGVWVMASTPLDEETKAKLQEMGQVKYVVAGDVVHHLYVGDFKKAYPEAKLIGVEGLPEKRPELKWDGVYGKDPEGTTYGFEDEISAQYFPTFGNKDLVFLHKESKSLLVVDILFNLPPKEQYQNAPSKKPTSWIPFMGHLAPSLSPMTSFHKTFLWAQGAGADFPSNSGKTGTSAQERRSRFAKDAEVVAGWNFDRIIPSHGDSIEVDAKKNWLTAFSKYLGEDGKAKV
ncbi:hypothetical protein CBS101457_006668 [Exobasidium rhododendri]|nr:hypothetical protein CBS101457_006668 [Exobasidium rhododendri]